MLQVSQIIFSDPDFDEKGKKIILFRDFFVFFVVKKEFLSF
jgi:hypothetical protein